MLQLVSQQQFWESQLFDWYVFLIKIDSLCYTDRLRILATASKILYSFNWIFKLLIIRFLGKWRGLEKPLAANPLEVQSLRMSTLTVQPGLNVVDVQEMIKEAFKEKECNNVQM